MSDEFELLAEIAEASSEPDAVDVGIGDDAAVLAGGWDVVTTDALVEGVHFDRGWCSAESVGWRALAASLSDIAAMGAEPGPFVTSFAAGPDWSDGEALDLVRGMERAAAELADPFDVGPVGGDLASTPGRATISVTLLGRTAGLEPVARSGATPGDRIYVTGHPGVSAGGVRVHSGEWRDVGTAAGLRAAYCRPVARTVLGRRLAREGIPTAMADVSDGLVADLGHVCESSGVGARIELDALPVDDRLEGAGWDQRDALDALLLTGGEDFELVFTAPPGAADRLESLSPTEDCCPTDVGAIVSGPDGVEVVGREGEQIDLDRGGFEHEF